MRKVFGLLLVVLGATAFSANAAVCSVGDRADVRWKGNWYKARVTRVNEDQTRCFIHYDGYGAEWDEWVGANRIRVAGGGASGSRFATGDSVEVRWKGKWYPARVLRAADGRYKVHYDGYGSEWDEWVGGDRIRD